MAIRHAIWLGILTAFCLAGCEMPVTVQSSDGGAKEKGAREAAAEIAAGRLKIKEYPPLPYSLQQINFIRLIKSECGVAWEVVKGPPDSPALRAEVAAYNDAMRGEINKKFGADIFQKLREKAEQKQENK